MSEARDQLTRERGREVDDFEVAEEADISVETVRTATMNNAAPQSLDPSVLDETITSTPWQEEESAESELARKEAVFRVRTELMRLSERDQMVMSLYYEEGLNLAEIGAILDVSQSRVSQLITKVKGTLKKRLTRSLEM